MTELEKKIKHYADAYYSRKNRKTLKQQAGEAR
jgi:hypothetical protein